MHAMLMSLVLFLSHHYLVQKMVLITYTITDLKTLHNSLPNLHSKWKSLENMIKWQKKLREKVKETFTLQKKLLIKLFLCLKNTIINMHT